MSAIVIWDLDGTLIDTACLEGMRRAQRWRECVARVSETSVHPNVLRTLQRLRAGGHKVAIVTNSVSFYARALVIHFQVEHDVLVAWHDTVAHKPDPAPILLAASLASAPLGAKITGVGDSMDDCLAYKAAGARSVGAGWSNVLDRAAPWEHILDDPEQLIALAEAD